MPVKALDVLLFIFMLSLSLLESRLMPLLVLAGNFKINEEIKLNR